VKHWFALTSALAAHACTPQPEVSAAVGEDECPYLPEFRQVEQDVRGLSPVQAAAEWDRYLLQHENPAFCEAADVDRRLGELERDLFLIVTDGQRIPCQLVLRCNQFDPVTAQCRGPMEDGTTGPLSPGVGTPLSGTHEPFAIVSSLPGTTVEGLFVTSMGDALDGRPATRLSMDLSAVTLSSGARNVILMAIYRTTGSWAYRKAVWYF
jgi:hypothetical protein